MAFSDAQPQLLFVTDVLGHCVHACDVIDKRHVGFVIPPGSIDEHPNGIASNRDLVAITVSPVASFVRIVKGSGTCTWTVLQDIRLPWNFCQGLRFSVDGQSLVVATAAGLACIKGCSADLFPFPFPFPLPLLDVQEAHGGWLVLDASGLRRDLYAIQERSYGSSAENVGSRWWIGSWGGHERLLARGQALGFCGQLPRRGNGRHERRQDSVDGCGA